MLGIVSGYVGVAITNHVIACGLYTHEIDKKTGELAMKKYYKRPDRGELKKFPMYTTHWFRHTNNTMMSEDGVPIEKRRLREGHKSDQQNEDYDHSVRTGVTTPLVSEHLKNRVV